MIGSLIGGALKIGGSIFGGISASKAMKRYKKNLQARKSANTARFNRRYNEDMTQRADAQRILTITQDNIRKRNQQAAGAQAVTGGTEESTATAKGVNNEALADATSQIAAAGERRKDALEAQHEQNDDRLQAQLDQLEVNKAAAIAKAVQGVGQAAGGIAENLDSTYASLGSDKDPEADVTDGRRYVAGDDYDGIYA